MGPKPVLDSDYSSQTCTDSVDEPLTEYYNIFRNTNYSLPTSSIKSARCSLMSLCALRSKKVRSVTFSDNIDYVSETHSGSFYFPSGITFGKQETAVYMTLCHNIHYLQRTSGTQATASINKCLQVCPSKNVNSNPRYSTTDSNWSTSTTATTHNEQNANLRRRGLPSQDVYFFGKSKKDASHSGMGKKQKETNHQKPNTIQSAKAAQVNQEKKRDSKVGSDRPHQNSKESSTNSKSVVIKDEKPCPACPAANCAKAFDLMATVSHIKIAPKEPCPVHGKEPCEGPKCIVASSPDQAPVKVSTVNNPRRGVFELVIRRMTGAPLAKNELMLEWTPPPSRPRCGTPCPTTCFPCPTSKCQMVVCRATTSCKRPCQKPCGLLPCSVSPCKRCCKPTCASPCVPCPPRRSCPRIRCRPCPPQTCPPPSCRPCPPLLCPPLTCETCCGKPCSSSPCLRPCPVGRRRPRKIRSQPRIKHHSTRISPCLNRNSCSVVRCSSVPGPCSSCLPCPPRKCSSGFPWKPKCCKSVCSSCCP